MSRFLGGSREELSRAARTLWRRPAYALTAISLLAGGLGANLAFFAVFDAVLLRPLPFSEPERIVRVWEFDRIRATEREYASAPDLDDWRASTTSFSELAGVVNWPATLTGVGEAQRLRGARVSENYFDVLGATPIVGQGFAGDEARADLNAVILGHEVWQTRFAGRIDVIGRTIRLDGQPYTVRGVMPAAAQIPFPRHSFWVPLDYAENERFRGRHGVQVLGRLAPGVPLERANAELTQVMAQLEEAYPDDNRGRGAFAVPLADDLVRGVRGGLTTLSAATALVLLIICLNLTGVSVARATERAQELLIREALGAPKGALVRLWLAESLIICATAVPVAWLLASWLLPSLLSLAPEAITAGTVALDARGLALLFGLTLLCWPAVGLLPALVTTAARGPRLHSSARGASSSPAGARARTALVLAEIAVSVILLAATGVLLRSFASTVSLSPGYETARLETMSSILPPAEFPFPQDWPVNDWAPGVAKQAEVLRRVRALPGVESATFSLNRPVESGWTTRMTTTRDEGREAGDLDETYFRPVGEQYLDTLGIPLLAGRGLTEFDNAQGPLVTLVNEAFVRKHFPERSLDAVLGEPLNVFGQPREVVGVVGDVRFSGLARPAHPTAYLPQRQNPLPEFAITVRLSAEAPSTIGAVRAVFAEVLPDAALDSATSVDAAISSAFSRQRFLLILLGLFAGTAVVLATTGIFAVIAYSVRSRRREMGVRAALGAAPARLLMRVLAQGVRVAFLGALAGCAVTPLTFEFLSAQLGDSVGFDLIVAGAAVVLMAAAGFLASLTPALHVMRMKPHEELRAE